MLPDATTVYLVSPGGTLSGYLLDPDLPTVLELVRFVSANPFCVRVYTRGNQ